MQSDAAPHLLENVEIALWLSSAAKRNGCALELLERFGLGALSAGRAPRGQQQCVAVARALANKLDILLMDEPAGNLDSAAEAELLSMLDGCTRRARRCSHGDQQPGRWRRGPNA